MKKIVVLILICIFFSSCNSKDDMEKDYVYDKRISDIANEILEGYKNKDVDRIKNVFAYNMIWKDGKLIEKSIEESFGYIDGEIVDYKEIHGGFVGGEIRDYEWVERSASASIVDIRTDSGKEYLIRYKAYLIDEDDSDNIGVWGYVISQTKPESDESFIVGEIN